MSNEDHAQMKAMMELAWPDDPERASKTAMKIYGQNMIARAMERT